MAGAIRAASFCSSTSHHGLNTAPAGDLFSKCKKLSSNLEHTSDKFQRASDAGNTERITNRTVTVAAQPERDRAAIPDVSGRVKRVYDQLAKSDGYRVFVDRLWPRGLKKSDAQLHDWLREIAPSTTLRQSFGHDPSKWKEFKKKYWSELDDR